MNYTIAWLNWSREGKPVRTDEQVAELRLICAGCEYFNGSICTHKKCGCKVAKAGIFGDKLRWATESCPIGKWGGGGQ